MTVKRATSSLLTLMTAATAALIPAAAAPAQNGRPQASDPPAPSVRPATPAQAPAPAPAPAPPAPAAQTTPPTNGNGSRKSVPVEESRRFVPKEMVTLAFNDVSVDQTFSFVARITGKVVIPVKAQMLKTQKVTLMNDEPIEKSRALDLLFEAFRLNDVGVIETDDTILIGQLTEITDIGRYKVLEADDDVMSCSDRGNVVVKFFRLKEASAESVAEQIEDHVPEYAKMTPDATSNQIMLQGDIALCQHIQRLVWELDQVNIPVETKTYRLRYADAQEIADNIFDLFDITDSGGAGRGAAQGQQRQQRPPRGGRNPQQQQQQQQQPTPGAAPGPTVEMRLTVNTQQNTVTVQADPAVVREVDHLIFEYWDLPRPEGTSKTYTLRYTDPIKVRDMLEELLEQGGGGGRARSASTRGGGGGAGGGTGGGRAGVEAAVSGIYQIEAYPDSGSLVVLCKTEESFGFLDSIVAGLDQPSTVGLPVVVELKHAEAVSLADEINILLAEAGSNMSLMRPDTGLSGQGASQTGGGSESGGAAAGATGGPAGRSAEEGADMKFPWMSGGRERDDQAPESSLIGKIRIVPIIRQNALAILAPPQYTEKVREIVHFLDQPGRQVMISAVIAEVELTDDFALGLRVSATDIPLTKIDNSISGSSSFEGTIDDVLDGIFDTGVLNVNTSVNVLLQALAEKTNVRVLQEPRVFTADNQEAVFFDGQDIPFVTDSFTNNTGGLTQGFEYRQVGVVLNVRPRITAEKDVDMEVYLELSSIVPGQTLFGGFIVDRRSTTTQVVIQDGQTIVVSGILRDIESEIKRKIPLLGDIPLIGSLFTSMESNKTTTELVAFITPLVVDNPSENETNFNAQDRLKLDAYRKPLKSYEVEKKRDEIRQRIVDPKQRGITAPEEGSLMVEPEAARPEPVGADLIKDDDEE